MSLVRFGAVPLAIPSGKQQAIAISAVTTSLDIIDLDTLAYTEFGNLGVAIPRGTSSAWALGSVPIIMPVGFHI